ncbi:Basic transcription factor 3 [Picochlorum sp. SENEW3]|jgi:nascent polypeptide-associated complex subunit beta|nr:hypothetical protein M9434_001422 [Picochlorum sp. BPE23]KAI8110142.1 hypothetical protein M9435_001821 [Picochlorum sp. BPE23]WPT11052.1 Basic transcription factor 3 [Picochlorum sp. SENEW3]WPT15860.1 Basic transcription factor 3 [Picochlorum sp. SENEW3]
MNVEKLQKLAGSVRTGGKGTMRRKKKAVHKSGSNSDSKLQSTLKRLGCNMIPGIEEVLMFNEDNTAIAFNNPKVQASIGANTYVVSGPAQHKNAQEALAAMFGGMSSTNIQQLMQQMQAMQAMQGNGAGEDDDDVPELVGNFEEKADDAE